MFAIALRAAMCAIFVFAPLASLSAWEDDLPYVTLKEHQTARAKMQFIALACQYYHGTHDVLPGNIEAKDGTALPSWRVALLPHMNEEALYKQFKLNEPWDSAHNKKLIEKMPSAYRPVRVKTKPGETFYQVFEGAESLFVPKKPPYTMLAISEMNGTSNTGLFFEAGSPVVWTKPADLPFDKNKPLPKLGGMLEGDFYVAWCDGHVALLKKDPDNELLKCIIMPGNMKVFDVRKLLKPPPGKS